MCSLFHLQRDCGWELFHEGRFEEAIAEWRLAADLDPEDGYILTSIGEALSKLGQPEAAFSEWQMAIHLEPEYDIPYIHLADALLAAGYADKALATVRTAIRLCPASANLYIRLGYYLTTKANENEDEKGWKAAAAAFQRAVDIEPKNANAHHSLGVLKWRLGEKSEATAAFKAIVSANPSDIEAYLKLFEYQARARQFRDMIQTIDVMNKVPDSEEKIAHYYFDLQHRLWAEARPILLVGAGMAAILAGVWVWCRRRGG